VRFTVGNRYTFIRTLFAPKEPGAFKGRLYQPWQDVLEGIEVISLDCVEHHKVPWDQDPNGEKTADGFVFRDLEGRTWHNQYPTACYGQLDDTNDRVVFLHFETEEVFEMESKDIVTIGENGERMVTPGKVKRGADGGMVVRDQAKMDAFESYFWNARMTLASSVLEVVYRAIHSTRDGIPQGYKNELQVYLDQLLSAIKSCTGEIVSFSPVRFRNKEGVERVAENLWDATLSQSAN